MKHDVFLSHASEDKEAVARPLAEELQRRGYDVWFDSLTLKLGDTLSRTIDRGLAESRFGVVILSRHFFAKNWPQRELSGMVTREMASSAKVILPVWHGVTHDDVAKYSLPLADKKAVSTSLGLPAVASEIADVLGSPIQKPLSIIPPARPRHSPGPRPVHDAAIIPSESREVRDGPEQLLRDAEGAMRTSEFDHAAKLMNRILSDYPDSRQASTVRSLSESIRAKQSQRDGPLTATETQAIRSTMDAFDQIRRNYPTTTREKQRALEAIFGADLLRLSDGSLESFSKSAASLPDAVERSRSGVDPR